MRLCRCHTGCIPACRPRLPWFSLHAPPAQFFPLSQLPPAFILGMVRHLAEPPLAPWLFLEPWGYMIAPDRGAIYAGLRELLKRCGVY